MISLASIPMRFLHVPCPKTILEAGTVSDVYAKIHIIIFCDDRFFFSLEEKKDPLKVTSINH